MDKANNYQPVAVKSQTMDKPAAFAARWQAEVLIHKKASTIGDMTGHINNLFIPAFGKLAMGDMDSERVQLFLNRQSQRLVNGKPISAKTIKNIWTTLRVMWNSAVAWKYADGELRVTLPKEKKLRMRSYTIDEAKRIFANTTGAEHVFYRTKFEIGVRLGELVGLRVSDVNLTNLSVDISKAASKTTRSQRRATELSVFRVCSEPPYRSI